MKAHFWNTLIPVVGSILFLAGTLHAQGNGSPPGDEPGTDHDIIVTPGSSPGSLHITFNGCTEDCDVRPVRASGNRRLNTVTWKFLFAGESIVSAEINFPEGTPLFSSVPGNGRRNRDERRFRERQETRGLARIQKRLKTLRWRTTDGVSEISDGDRFKYDVKVTTELDGVTKEYFVDPIVIVRGSEDSGGR